MMVSASDESDEAQRVPKKSATSFETADAEMYSPAKGRSRHRSPISTNHSMERDLDSSVSASSPRGCVSSRSSRTTSSNLIPQSASISTHVCEAATPAGRIHSCRGTHFHSPQHASRKGSEQRLLDDAVTCGTSYAMSDETVLASDEIKRIADGIGRMGDGIGRASDESGRAVSEKFGRAERRRATASSSPSAVTASQARSPTAPQISARRALSTRGVSYQVDTSVRDAAPSNSRVMSYERPTPSSRQPSPQLRLRSNAPHAVPSSVSHASTSRSPALSPSTQLVQTAESVGVHVSEAEVSAEVLGAAVRAGGWWTSPTPIVASIAKCAYGCPPPRLRSPDASRWTLTRQQAQPTQEQAQPTHGQ
eukprot:1424526-Pleurochrysis_carterae.AAC.1